MMRRPLYLPVLIGALCLAQAAGAQEIGRLFTTADERAVIERGRFAKKPVAGQAAADTPAPEAPPELLEGEQILVVNGVVRRSGSGRETTWIDSVPHTGSARLAGGAALAQDHSGKVALTLRSGKVVKARVGQNVDAVSGQVRESYQPPVTPKPRVSADPAE